MAPDTSRIIILGTASDINAMTQGRTSSGVLIDDTILIDPGIGCVLRLLQAGINISKISTILVSNHDTVYSNDINAIIEHTKEAHLICTPKILKYDESILTVRHSKHLKILKVENTNRTNIKGYDIESEHNKKDSLTFKISSDKYSIAYISKSYMSKQLMDLLKDSNIVIINHNSSEDYLLDEDIIKIATDIEPELIILTGFDKKNSDKDTLEIARTLRTKIKSRTQILPGKELMIIDPKSYNIKKKQKNLDKFL